MKSIIQVICFLTLFNVFAQVGIGTTSPDASSILDVTSTDKGMLVPRVSLLNVTNGTLPIATPATSLLVWNTNAAVVGGNGIGYYYWNGTWESLFADNLGNHNATTTLDLNSNEITEVQRLSTLAVSSYDKLRVWNAPDFTIGMHSVMTYGFLNDFAMTFTMNNNANRGWVFRDDVDSQADGAMSLTTDGRMTVKRYLNIPYTGDASGAVNSGGFQIGGRLRIDGDEIITNTNTILSLQNGNNGDLRVDASTLVVDASTNRVGIRTTAPVANLHVNGGRVEFTGTTDASGVSGTGVLEIGNTLRIDGNEIITNTNQGLHLQNLNNGDLFVDTNTLVVDSSLNRVGIGTVAPVQKLDVRGNLRVSGNIQYVGTITDISDRRLKENFENITSVTNRLKQITGYSYNMIDDANKKREYGVIAQDLQKVFPEMVSVIDKENGYLGVSYVQLIPVLLEGIKEQQLEIDALKAQLKNYKQLEARIMALETND